METAVFLDAKPVDSWLLRFCFNYVLGFRLFRSSSRMLFLAIALGIMLSGVGWDLFVGFLQKKGNLPTKKVFSVSRLGEGRRSTLDGQPTWAWDLLQGTNPTTIGIINSFYRSCREVGSLAVMERCGQIFCAARFAWLRQGECVGWAAVIGLVVFWAMAEEEGDDVARCFGGIGLGVCQAGRAKLTLRR